jgi:hypothetical protein
VRESLEQLGVVGPLLRRESAPVSGQCCLVKQAVATREAQAHLGHLLFRVQRGLDQVLNTRRRLHASASLALLLDQHLPQRVSKLEV